MGRLVDDVQQGELAGLQSLRDRLASALEDARTPAHAVAPLTRQLQGVLKRIDELDPPPREPDRVDLLRIQREERRRTRAEETG